MAYRIVATAVRSIESEPIESMCQDAARHRGQPGAQTRQQRHGEWNWWTPRTTSSRRIKLAPDAGLVKSLGANHTLSLRSPTSSTTASTPERLAGLDPAPHPGRPTQSRSRWSTTARGWTPTRGQRCHDARSPADVRRRRPRPLRDGSEGCVVRPQRRADRLVERVRRRRPSGAGSVARTSPRTSPARFCRPTLPPSMLPTARSILGSLEGTSIVWTERSEHLSRPQSRRGTEWLRRGPKRSRHISA